MRVVYSIVQARQKPDEPYEASRSLVSSRVGWYPLKEKTFNAAEIMLRDLLSDAT